MRGTRCQTLEQEEFEARLQLIDIYRTKPAMSERAIELFDQILGKEVGEQGVTYSVLLGVIERLPWGAGSWRLEVIRRHSDAIERTIVDAANEGIQQAFEAFAALGRFLSVEEPAMFERIFARLPGASLDGLTADRERFSRAEIYFEASRLPGTDAAQLQALALAYYEGEVKPQRFHLQRRAELLIEMGRASAGEVLLRPRRPKIQRLAAAPDGESATCAGRCSRGSDLDRPSPRRPDGGAIS